MFTTSRIFKRLIFGAALLGTAAYVYAQGVTTQEVTVRMNFKNGVQLNGSTLTRVQHARITTGSCGTSGCLVTLTWPVTFGDTSYTSTCVVHDTTAVSELALQVLKIRTKTATGIDVDVANLSAGSITGTLECMGIHD